MTEVKRRARKEKAAETKPDAVADDKTVVGGDAPNPPRKRGRKPKGGKIVQHSLELNAVVEPSPNIILHLKCSMKDIDRGGEDAIPTHDADFMLSKTTELNFQTIDGTGCPQTDTGPTEIAASDTQKNIHDKVRELEKLLHFNSISNKRSACFWCTCDFDNPPIHIPKFKIKDTYHVYGCFCSPECAAAHLTSEHIDTSSKFERYHLLNFLYAGIYNHDRNIKPAPDPHYTLDKFCGNLTIQEYRKLLHNDNLLLVVDKPLTRILPELHEDNDDFLLNNRSIPSNAALRLKRSKTSATKSEIMSENFGFA